MLLELLIAIIILVVVVVVFKAVAAFMEFPPMMVHCFMVVAGGLFLIYLLQALWPFVSHGH